MTQEDKELLLKDLCARLPYGVKIRIEYPFYEEKDWYPEDLCGIDLERMVIANTSIRIEEFKPYLRPMSSMTEEEIKELRNLCDITPYTDYDSGRYINEYGLGVLYEDWPSIDVTAIDYLNSIHVDYRGLIPMGLALEAPEGMYSKQ